MYVNQIRKMQSAALESTTHDEIKQGLSQTCSELRFADTLESFLMFYSVFPFLFRVSDNKY